MMQFQLRTLFVAVTAAAMLCGVVFGLSATWCGILLLVVMLITPSIWLTAALCAEGKRQVFYRAGLIAGAMPFVCCVITMGFMITQAISNGGMTLLIPAYSADPSAESVTVDKDKDLEIRLSMGILWLTPGVFSLLGGAASLLTHRMISPRQSAPPQKEQPAKPEGLAGYRIISGRLKTAAIETPPTDPFAAEGCVAPAARGAQGDFSA